MKQALLYGVLVLSLVPAANVQAANWRTDYESAKAEARRTGKPLFVVFRCQP